MEICVQGSEMTQTSEIVNYSWVDANSILNDLINNVGRAWPPELFCNVMQICFKMNNFSRKDNFEEGFKTCPLSGKGVVPP